jgi:chromosome segregation ATPase
MFEIFKNQINEPLTERIPNNKQKRKKRLAKLKNNTKIFPQNLKKNEETVLSILKSLSEEEKELMVEKNQLLDMEETLKKRIINEIDTKKSRITDLQLEIPELKHRVEFLAKMLEIPIVK